MGWTFREYDETPAKDIYSLLELWKIQKLHQGEGVEEPGMYDSA